MNQRAEIVRVAAQEVGTLENPKNSNRIKYNTWYYGKEVSGSAYPYCMVFVSWCAAQCGISTGTIPKLAYVPYCVDFYQKQGRYKAKGSYKPQPGDLIIYGSNSHIGIVEKVQGNTVFTIEGNTSANGNSSNGDGVYRRSRALSDSWIKGYCLPDYKEEEEVEIKTIKVKDLSNGEMIPVQAINVEGNNYVKLRDMEKLVEGVQIGWDGKNPTIEKK